MTTIPLPLFHHDRPEPDLLVEEIAAGERISLDAASDLIGPYKARPNAPRGKRPPALRLLEHWIRYGIPLDCAERGTRLVFLEGVQGEGPPEGGHRPWYTSARAVARFRKECGDQL